jgi:hypothetical protein
MSCEEEDTHSAAVASVDGASTCISCEEEDTCMTCEEEDTYSAAVANIDEAAHVESHVDPALPRHVELVHRAGPVRDAEAAQRQGGRASTCMSYEEEDTYMSYEEDEDTCGGVARAYARELREQQIRPRETHACHVRRRIHACHMRRIHACHMRRRIHACHVRRRIHACHMMRPRAKHA